MGFGVRATKIHLWYIACTTVLQAPRSVTQPERTSSHSDSQTPKSGQTNATQEQAGQDRRKDMREKKREGGKREEPEYS